MEEFRRLAFGVVETEVARAHNKVPGFVLKFLSFIFYFLAVSMWIL
jgi:hypothetical protein